MSPFTYKSRKFDSFPEIKRMPHKYLDVIKFHSWFEKCKRQWTLFDENNFEESWFSFRNFQLDQYICASSYLQYHIQNTQSFYIRISKFGLGLILFLNFHCSNKTTLIEEIFGGSLIWQMTEKVKFSGIQFGDCRIFLA